MSYQDITQYNAACFTPGRPYGITSITIHWWGDPSDGPTFDGVIRTFTSGARGTSAHYVVEDGRVACLVAPGDRAWACGDGVGVGSGGNDTSISIECNPRQSDGDYRTVAELVRDLRAVYGDLPLYPHSRWFNTRCPGTYDLSRIDRIARGLPDTGHTPPALMGTSKVRPGLAAHVHYRLHRQGGDWLDWVDRSDINDTVNGCAGVSGQVIDAVQLHYTTPAGRTLAQAWYRSQTAARQGWLPTVCDDGTSYGGDAFAGMFGEPLDRLQIAISDGNPF